MAAARTIARENFSVNDDGQYMALVEKLTLNGWSAANGIRIRIP